LIELDGAATAFFSTGTYFVSTFQVDPTSTANLETSAGPVVLVVQNIQLHPGVFVDAHHPVPLLSIDYLGSTDLDVFAPFGGTIIAPRANLVLEGSSLGRAYAGQFFAKSIETHESLIINHAPLSCP
jgi:hypothetical protein